MIPNTIAPLTIMQLAGTRTDDAASSLGVAEGLCLAATPTFALMALLTSIFDGGPLNMLCMPGQGVPQFGGMVPMYLLMSLFHAAPWLRLLGR
jgi:hypothetical protein